MIRRLTLSSLAGALAMWLCCSAATAQDESDGKAASKPKKVNKPAAKVTEDSVEVPDGKPDQLLEKIQQGPRITRGQDQMEQFKKYIFMVSKTADAIVAHPDATAEQKTEAIQTKVRVLNQGSRLDSKTFTKKYKDYLASVLREKPTPGAVEIAKGYELVDKLFSSGGKMPSDEAIGELKSYAKQYPKGMMGPQLFGGVAKRLEMSGQTKRASELLKEGVALFKGNEMAEQLQNELKAMNIVGSPMPIEGPTLQGPTFNIDSLKGKVVLVDFWATWCGPCVGELPNVQRAYEKYHDKGFEIVGVSLDQDKDKLKEFVEEKKMPWAQIVFDERSKMGWSNPIARQYGINSIPATFLLDRSGKVVARGLRGEALMPAIEKELRKPATPVAN